MSGTDAARLTRVARFSGGGSPVHRRVASRLINLSIDVRPPSPSPPLLASLHQRSSFSSNCWCGCSFTRRDSLPRVCRRGRRRNLRWILRERNRRNRSRATTPDVEARKRKKEKQEEKRKGVIFYTVRTLNKVIWTINHRCEDRVWGGVLLVTTCDHAQSQDAKNRWALFTRPFFPFFLRLTDSNLKFERFVRAEFP